MTNAVIVDIVRTASGKGKPGGALSGTHPVDLLATVLRALVQRNDLEARPHRRRDRRLRHARVRAECQRRP